MWGGLVPDALITLSRLVATLHDDQGNVAVEGLHSGPAADVDYPEERLRAESGASPGVEWIGSGSIVERLWTKPSLSIIGLDATQGRRLVQHPRPERPRPDLAAAGAGRHHRRTRWRACAPTSSSTSRGAPS